MKRSNLFSFKQADQRDTAESYANKTRSFRLQPYAMAVALAILAFSFYQYQPRAQEQPADAPPAAAVSDAQPTESTQPETVNPPAEQPETPLVSEIPATPAITPPIQQSATPENENFSAAEDVNKILQSLQTPDVMPNSTDAATSELPQVEVGASDVQVEKILPSTPFFKTDGGKLLIGFSIFLLIVVISSLLANAAAKSWRMQEHAFKFFVVLLAVIGSITATVTSWHKLTLGIDLSGGVVLVYDVKPHQDRVVGEETTGEDGAKQTAAVTGVVSQTDFEDLVKAINNRINPAGVKEIVVQRYGTSQLKIVIPNADAAEVRRIERLISEAGTLEFRILASRSMAEDQSLISRAEQQPGATRIYNEAGTLIEGLWVPINEKEANSFESPQNVTRKTGGITEILVLKDRYDVNGSYLRNVSSGVQQTDKGPKQGVTFSLDSRGTQLFAGLTGQYASRIESGRTRYMGIIMSGEMYSAPTLEEPIPSGNCSITFNSRPNDEGGVQLKQDVQDLLQIMRAGALPADVGKQPISENQMGATLGDATIQSGKISGIIAIAGIFLFMLVYYQACGMVACFCVVMNLFLIMAVMLAIRAAFTLAGLAGLVLTLGMAVDANILIYERLREEMDAGSTLRLAIRNAFSRAATAIIDSNVTTLIVAVILYLVGTEQTKGFAVTLFLGVVFTMFTSVYCARVIFDVAERRRWIVKATMFRILNRPNINFMSARKYSVAIFAALCVLSIIFATARGKTLYDIDFVGGVSVEVVFKESQNDEEVRKALSGEGLADLTVTTVRDAVENNEANKKVAATQSTHFTITAATPPDTNANEYLKQITSTVKKTFSDKLVYDTIDFTSTESTSPAGAVQTVAKITVDPSMNYKSLDQYVKDYMNQLAEAEDAAKKIPNVFSYVITSEENASAAETSAPYKNWTITFNGDKTNVDKVLSTLETEFDANPWFPASNTIGGVVATYARVASVAAVLASFVAIVLYLWLRFHKMYFGIAAVVTLINNILITLGAISASYWLRPYLGFLQVEEFKIGSTVIAAFLTIIGYSINDTIILFDRIREVRGKSSLLTVEHINQSTNQVLSRTLLTSFTTLFVIFVLYFLGGAGLHTFAYALAIGITVGTFGSIFLASPLLYWMVNEPGNKSASKKKK
ncbi:MAG: protein translocase subunit SecD [Planctomycetaceae bacterium]|jgi:SecD/SecF fusion protein|nr:protein translocase subunit SecD [Planctomycetaceae bacterium]